MDNNPIREIKTVEDSIEFIRDLLKNEIVREALHTTIHQKMGIPTSPTMGEILAEREKAALESRVSLAKELIDYRKKHSLMYGNQMTYLDEGEYLNEILQKAETELKLKKGANHG